jgi:hypothetical protein
VGKAVGQKNSTRTMKRLFTLISFTVGILLMIYILLFGSPFNFIVENEIKKANCLDRQNALEESIEGVVINKFRDKESHMWKTIEYSHKTKSSKSLILMNDRSGAYDFILPGDSILKNRNSLEFKITRSGVVTIYQLDFECKPE